LGFMNTWGQSPHSASNRRETSDVSVPEYRTSRFG
jgi:hypothetical protein